MTWMEQLEKLFEREKSKPYIIHTGKKGMKLWEEVWKKEFEKTKKK